MRAAVCTLGNISIDDLVFADGSTQWCIPGGNAIYSALGAALWQHRPVVMAPVGPDYPTDVLQERLDLSRCPRVPRTLRNWGLYEDDGSRSFIFRRDTRKWEEFSPTLADLDGFVCDAAHLAPLRWELQIAIAERLRADGTRLISVDPDDRYLSALSPETVGRLLSDIDLFLPSRQDVEALFPGRSPLDALRRLRAAAPELPAIAIKCGAKGVIIHAADDADYFELPAIAGHVVDATGAGDAFSGGALVGYAATRSVIEAALWGSVSASFAVEATGPAQLIAATKECAQSRLAQLRARISTHPL
ncbi:MAG: PfkB family carbohydrate kinase [Ancalomicrobiaceae bacterium]|nr:PfkB family carbohydrate kinase [Ancalomicrobiaceae bacterium]